MRKMMNRKKMKTCYPLRPMGLSAEVELSRMLRGTFAKLSRKIVFIFDVSFLKFLLES